MPNFSISNDRFLLSCPVDFLRRILVRASIIPVLGKVMSSYYHLAVRNLVREISALPGTISLFARNSYASGSFQPGASDIDVIVIVKDDLSCRAMQSLMVGLYDAFARLRHRFPMLDAFPIYTERSFAAACRLGPISAETYAWKCLWGKSLLFQTTDAQRVPRTERIARAVQVFLTGYQVNLCSALMACRKTTTLPMERSGLKLKRALRTIGEWNNFEVREAIPTALSGAINAIHSVLETVDEDLTPYTGAIIGAPGDIKSTDESIINLNPDSPHSCFDAVIFREPDGPNLFLLSEPVTAKVAQAALNWVGENVSQGINRANFLTKSILRFHLQNIAPILYFGLKRRRTVEGIDAFAQVPPPSLFGVKRFFVFETAHFLKLPITLWATAGSDSEFLQGFRKRYSRIMHFIERDEILLTTNPPDDLEGNTLLDLRLSMIPCLLDRLQDRTQPLSNIVPLKLK